MAQVVNLEQSQADSKLMPQETERPPGNPQMERSNVMAYDSQGLGHNVIPAWKTHHMGSYSWRPDQKTQVWTR